MSSRTRPEFEPQDSGVPIPSCAIFGQSSMSQVTQLLEAIGRGDTQAGQALLDELYDDLRSLARQQLARERPGHTLQATALVHEAWLRLAPGGHGPAWENRGHFFGAAAEAMRRILVESARRRSRKRRGGDLLREDLAADAIAAPLAADPDELIDLDEALDRFVAIEPRKAELVKLRYFAGLSLEEAATVLGIGASTADRDWAYAKAWLYQQLTGDGPKSAVSE